MDVDVCHSVQIPCDVWMRVCFGHPLLRLQGVERGNRIRGSMCTPGQSPKSLENVNDVYDYIEVFAIAPLKAMLSSARRRAQSEAQRP